MPSDDDISMDFCLCEFQWFTVGGESGSKQRNGGESLGNLSSLGIRAGAARKSLFTTCFKSRFFVSFFRRINLDEHVDAMNSAYILVSTRPQPHHSLE